MVELPTTIGFLIGAPAASALRRAALEKSFVGRGRLVGVLDRLGLLAKRWLSPETSTARELLLLARACVESDRSDLALTFNSSALLPGATHYVRVQSDLDRLVARADCFVEYCVDQGFEFATLTELGRRILAATTWKSRGAGRVTTVARKTIQPTTMARAGLLRMLLTGRVHIRHGARGDVRTTTWGRNATAYGVSPKLRPDGVINDLVGYAIKTGEVVILSDGTPVHIRDFSRAFLADLEAPRDAIHDQFNLGRTSDIYQVRIALDAQLRWARASSSPGGVR